MTLLDTFIVVFCLVLAAVGWQQGLVTGALSLAGFALGAFLGTRLAGALLAQGDSSPYAPLVGLGAALVVGGLFSFGLEAVGMTLHRRLGMLAPVDGALGSVLFVALALGLAWIGAAFVAQAPGTSRDLRRDIQRSAILSRLNDALPPSGPLLHALSRIDPLPEFAGPPAQIGPPARGTPRDPDVQAAAGRVVRVTGTACGLGVEGSGWVARRGKVVTNAHVVAGERDTKVQIRGRGQRLDATVVALDVRNDVAVLRVPGLGATPRLRTTDDARPGRAAAVLGFPRNGPYDVRPARLAQTATASAQDAYGRGPVLRKILTLRANVRPGNSGGPVVDADGRVVATVFASSRGSDVKTGYAIPNSIVERAIHSARGAVSSGPCAG